MRSASGHLAAVGRIQAVFRRCTAILIFAKSNPTESVWFYELTADGYSLDDKRTPLPDNPRGDIPDVLAKWPTREEGRNSFRVSTQTIRDNGWQLMPGRYRPAQLRPQRSNRQRKFYGG